MLTWKLIDELAASLAKPNARRMWKSRGLVPSRHRGPIMEIAAARGMGIRWSDFDRLRAEPTPRRRQASARGAGAAA